MPRKLPRRSPLGSRKPKLLTCPSHRYHSCAWAHFFKGIRCLCLTSKIPMVWRRV